MSITPTQDACFFESEADMLRSKGYIIKNVIGEGSYSKVKRGCSVALRRDVAIKIIHREMAADVFRQRFLPREINILSIVNHPKIVKVYEIFETKIPSKVYIVTEFVRNGDLLDHVKSKGAVSESDAKFILKDICQALLYLHNNQIAHRDIKCENILLERCPQRRFGLGFEAKLCDFGFAKNFPGLNPHTNMKKGEWSTSTFCGSTAYASPEILERRAHNALVSDIWAYGIVAFITLFAAMPFDDSDLRSMVEHQKDGNVVEQVNRKISKCGQNYISSCLHPKPSKRPSAKALLSHTWLNENSADRKNTESAPSTELAELKCGMK